MNDFTPAMPDIPTAEPLYLRTRERSDADWVRIELFYPGFFQDEEAKSTLYHRTARDTEAFIARCNGVLVVRERITDR